MEKKTVLITGASSGIGKETASMLSEQGYSVYALARRLEKMEDLKAKGIHILPVDITDDQALTTAVESVLRQEGRIDVLINNAGFGLSGAIEDIPLQEARYQMEVNVFGLARITQLVLPSMRNQHSGKIINVSSIGGKVSTPISGWYHASKFAVEALSDSLRMEVKGFGIDVVVIEPGAIKTEWSGIARDKMSSHSGNSVYKSLAEGTSAFLKKYEPKSSPPRVIAELIYKSIKARRPKTRYHGGFTSGLVLFTRKILSDKMLDKMLLMQLK